MTSARDESAGWNEDGRVHADEGRTADAEACYRRAIDADPSWSVPHYNLGLLCKYASRWDESLAANRLALERDPRDPAAAWNLGIAATALGDWDTARRAWRACGIALPDGDGPVSLDFGLVPIRLDPESRAEVVWAQRIDPARARLANIPFPESGHHFGDLVLHDGAAAGERTISGRTVPVFNALALLERSNYQTFVIWAPRATADSIAALIEIAEHGGCAVEDWTSSVRYICARCSEGSALPGHEHAASETETARNVQPALAARDLGEAMRIAQQWSERACVGPVSVRPA